MTFNLKVRKSDGFIKSAGFSEFEEDKEHVLIRLSSIIHIDFCLNDSQGRRKVRWDFENSKITDIIEGEKEENETKKQWKKCKNAEEKIDFISKILNL